MPIPAGRAFRIETERLVLRPFRPEEAALLGRAVLESLEHLRPWMPWTQGEPLEEAQRALRLRETLGRFEQGTDLMYGAFGRESGRVLGSSGLHDRAGDARVREIGYWVHVDFVGRGLATELSAALTRAGFECEGAGRIEIHCDPRNTASAAVPRKLGYRLREIRKQHRPDGEGSLRDGMIWELGAEEFAASPAAGFSQRFIRRLIPRGGTSEA